MSLSRLSKPHIGVLLINTGTPDEPTPRAVRSYLAQFLADRRVIEYPRWIWLPILHGLILNLRPRRSARLYQRIWTERGSPLLLIGGEQTDGVSHLLTERLGVPIKIELGMRYGNPSIAAGLRLIREREIDRILAFPLYPQYSSTTTGTALEAVISEVQNWRLMPALRTVSSYYNHPLYIEALVESVLEHWQTHGKAERLLFSFHGIPNRYVISGDPYPEHCRWTGTQVARLLNLAEEDWQVSFQSRFGPQKWLQPYTDILLDEWGRAGVNSVQVICPGFAADCLETLEEIKHSARTIFLKAGGKEYAYIPALNARPKHLAAIADIIQANLLGWLD